MMKSMMLSLLVLFLYIWFSLLTTFGFKRIAHVHSCRRRRWKMFYRLEVDCSVPAIQVYVMCINVFDSKFWNVKIDNFVNIVDFGFLAFKKKNTHTVHLIARLSLSMRLFGDLTWCLCIFHHRNLSQIQ